MKFSNKEFFSKCLCSEWRLFNIKEFKNWHKPQQNHGTAEPCYQAFEKVWSMLVDHAVSLIAKSGIT